MGILPGSGLEAEANLTEENDGTEADMWWIERRYRLGQQPSLLEDAALG